MDVTQFAINTLLGVASGAMGWILKVVWDSLQMLKRTDDELASKVNAIEVLVAGTYVTRQEFRAELVALHSKLDKVLEVLSKKMDRR